MTYVYNNKVYEIDYVSRNLENDIEIFLIDPDTRNAISIHDLPDFVQDDLWVACSDIMAEDLRGVK